MFGRKFCIHFHFLHPVSGVAHLNGFALWKVIFIVKTFGTAAAAAAALWEDIRLRIYFRVLFSRDSDSGDGGGSGVDAASAW